MRARRLTFLGTMFIGVAAAAQDHHHGAHVHGQWDMFVAQDGDQLSITLQGPLVDILGFEHSPKTADQRAAVNKAKNQLDNPGILLTVDPDARCSPSQDPALRWPDGFDHDHDHHGEHHAHGDHAGNLEVTYSFQCRAVGKLNRITFEGFSTFPSLTQVDAVFLGDAGQVSDRLAPGAPILVIK